MSFQINSQFRADLYDCFFGSSFLIVLKPTRVVTLTFNIFDTIFNRFVDNFNIFNRILSNPVDSQPSKDQSRRNRYADREKEAVSLQTFSLEKEMKRMLLNGNHIKTHSSGFSELLHFLLQLSEGIVDGVLCLSPSENHLARGKDEG